MKEVIKELNQKYEKVNETRMNFERAIDALAKINDFEGKREMIDKIRTMRDIVDKERDDIWKAISALQKVCNHKKPDGSDAYTYNGHDSHYNYEKCTICGHEEKN